jgi:serine/threonine-protein kinase HipA
MSKLNVFFESIKVGELERNDELVHSFTYSEDWLQHPRRFPLSLAMPLQKQSFGNKITLSFFENLLPEGEIRTIIGRAHQVESPYEFLKEFGQDCAGAVIVTENESSPFEAASGERVEIDMNRVFAAIEQNHNVAHVIAEMDPGYLSLAGAQDKFPAIFEDGKFFLPKRGAPTTHIVKVPIKRNGVKESVYNEYYCMQLARAVGLNVPHCQVIGEGTHPLFVIERYDRIVDESGNVQRIHQQDFCQAQGVVSEQKYEERGGPSIKDNYQLIVKNVGIKKRAANTFAFLDWICFNLLIGNNDSHSKNISFLLRDDKVELAPAYDLLCTAIYPNLKREFSFKVGDRNDANRIGKNQLSMLDEELQLKTGTVEERLRLLHKKVHMKKDEVAQALQDSHPGVRIAQRISDFIADRSRSLERQGVRWD